MTIYNHTKGFTLLAIKVGKEERSDVLIANAW